MKLCVSLFLNLYHMDLISLLAQIKMKSGVLKVEDGKWSFSLHFSFYYKIVD